MENVIFICFFRLLISSICLSRMETHFCHLPHLMMSFTTKSYAFIRFLTTSIQWVSLTTGFVVCLLVRSMSAFKEDNCSTFDGENSILMTQVYRDSSDVSDWLILARENSNHSSNQSEIAHGSLLIYVTRMELFVSSLTHLRGGRKLSV